MYNKYASALFLFAPCIRYHYFQKGLQKRRASALSLNKKQSSMYNKYACGCFLYAPSICSTYLSKRWQRCGHLRCCAQINPQRIKDTPPVNLCSRLVSTPSIFKSAGKGGCIYGVAAQKRMLNLSKIFNNKKNLEKLPAFRGFICF